MTTEQATTPRGLRLWLWVGGLATLATGALIVAAFGWAHRQDQLWSWLQPSALLTAFSVLGLWLMTLISYVVPRHRQGRPVTLTAIVVTAGLACLLGLASTLRCTTSEDAALTPVWQTLTMFVGTSPGVFGQGRCASAVPLAAQLGRTLAIIAVFATAAAVALNLMSTQARRLLSRFRSCPEVVIGFDDASAPLVRTLQLWRKKGTAVVVLVGADRQCDTAAATSLGAQVFPISMDSVDPLHEANPTGSHVEQLSRHLTPFLATGKKFTTRRVWIMEADPVRALQIKYAVDSLLAKRDFGHTVRVLVRCDDPALAEQWRAAWVSQEQQPDAKEVLHEPLSRTEITAVELVGRLFRDGGQTPRRRPWHLVLCGDTALTEAVGVELALRCWESHKLEAEWQKHSQECEAPCAGSQHDVDLLGCDPDDLLVGGCAPSGVLLMAPNADAILQRIASVLSPEVKAAWTALAPRAIEGDWTQLGSRAVFGEHVEVIVTDVVESDQMHIANRLRSQQPAIERVWIRAPRSAAARPVSLSSGLEVYAENVLLHGKLPEDSWTGIARMTHERFRRAYFTPGRPERKPWWHSNDEHCSSPELREDNLQEVRGLLRGVVGLGYVWVRDPNGHAALAEGEWWILARQEHSRWRKNQEKLNKSDTPKPDDKDWELLSTSSQESNRSQVEEALGLITAYGYGVRRAYRGRGTVTAESITQDQAVHTATGIDEAHPGQWLIRGPDGQVERVVPAAAFTADFTAGLDGTFTRGGEYSAHKADGLWVVNDAHGNCWTVTPEQFEAAYVKAAVGQVLDVSS